MPTRFLTLTGIFTILASALLFWVLTINPFELHSWDALIWPILFWLSVSLAGAGGWLLLRAGLGALWKRSDPNSRLRMFPDMILRNVLPWSHHHKSPLITELPNFGLFFGAVLWILVFIFMILEQHTYHGLPIDLSTYELMSSVKSPWTEPLSVYLGVGEKYYVNGKEVPRDALRETLRHELDRTAVWTVYFEADGDTLNMNAIYAMSVIQNLGAKLVWITPKVREQLEAKKPIFAPSPQSRARLLP